MFSLSPGGFAATGNYRLVRLLGEGGMAHVWEAEHTTTHERVALKIAKAIPGDPEAHSRFLREARAASAVKHPNVVQVRETVELDDGSPAFAMELLTGESLAERLERRHVLQLPELASVMAQATSALAAAHGRGLLHRDVKPTNIFLARGSHGGRTVKVLDFGLARILPPVVGSMGRLSARGSGVRFGTPEYMAPEQVTGEKELDGRVDVWALGMVAYQCLSGILPTAGTGVDQVLEHVLERPIWPIRDAVPEVPQDLAALIDRMLSRDRAERPADLSAIGEMFAKYAGDLTTEDTPSVRPNPDDEGSRHGPTRSSAVHPIAVPPDVPMRESKETIDLGLSSGDVDPERALVEAANDGVPSTARSDAALGGTPVDVEPATRGSNETAAIPEPLLRGAVFAGRYRILKPIASGGMGAVYEVLQLETSRRRALKVMHRHVLDGKDARERFRREARVGARVASEHIVEVLDAGIDDATKTPFIVMELLQGEELGRRLKRLGRLSAGEVIRHVYQTALALEKAHEASIVHRDIKPENLFLLHPESGSERIKVLDFGIAKPFADGNTSAGATQILGTPLYMAPEQFRTDVKLSPAADVFALGMVAYTLLVGAPYWREESVEGNLFALIATAMQGPREAATARARRQGVVLPPAFDPWFARMTGADPEKRPAEIVASVLELAAALGVETEDPRWQRLGVDRGSVASKPPAAPSDSTDRGRRSRIAGYAVAATMVGLISTAFLRRGNGDADSMPIAEAASIQPLSYTVASNSTAVVPAPSLSAVAPPGPSPALSASVDARALAPSSEIGRSKPGRTSLPRPSSSIYLGDD